MQTDKKTITILSKNEDGLSLEFVVETDALDNILQTRYKNKDYKIISPNELPPLFHIYPFCHDVSDWTNLTFYVKDIYKAKDLQKEGWRSARKPILERLDVEYIRAVEVNDTKKQQEIVSKKQALRDVTLTPLPDDLEGIRNTWPSILDD